MISYRHTDPITHYEFPFTHRQLIEKSVIYMNKFIKYSRCMMTFKQLRVAVYADGADKDAMIAEYKKGYVTGFTTNPSLMKKAGVTDYVSFAKDVVAAIPDLPLSFEVFGDDFETMEKEAKIISALGKNVFVKIPIMLTDGTSTAPLIKKLSEQGIQLNVTAIFTIGQVRAAVNAFKAGTKNIVSVRLRCRCLRLFLARHFS